jgi:hypothetical protein
MATDLDPVEVWQPEIEQYQLELAKARFTKRALPRPGPPHIMTMTVKKPAHSRPNRLVVFDKEQPGHKVTLGSAASGRGVIEALIRAATGLNQPTR